MRLAGIDIGSRTIELVVLKDREIIETKQVDSGFDPMTQTKELLGNMTISWPRAMVDICLSFPLMRPRSRISRPMPWAQRLCSPRFERYWTSGGRIPRPLPSMMKVR